MQQLPSQCNIKKTSKRYAAVKMQACPVGMPRDTQLTFLIHNVVRVNHPDNMPCTRGTYLYNGKF